MWFCRWLVGRSLRVFFLFVAALSRRHNTAHEVHFQRLRLEDSACHLPHNRGRGERVGFRCKSILSVTRGMVGLGGVGFLGLPRSIHSHSVAVPNVDRLLDLFS